MNIALARHFEKLGLLAIDISLKIQNIVTPDSADLSNLTESYIL